MRETCHITFDVHEVPRLCEQLLTFYMKNGGNVLACLTLRSEITRLVKEHNEKEVDDLKRYSMARPGLCDNRERICPQRSVTPTLLYSEPFDMENFYNSLEGETPI